MTWLEFLRADGAETVFLISTALLITGFMLWAVHGSK